MDTTRYGKETGGIGGVGFGQNVSKRAEEGVQAAGAADSFEGPYCEPVEAFRIEKCAGAAAWERSTAEQRGGVVHGALRPPGNGSEYEGRQYLQRRGRQCHGMRNSARTGARVGGHVTGAAAIDSLCVGDSGRTRAAGVRVPW